MACFVFEDFGAVLGHTDPGGCFEYGTVDDQLIEESEEEGEEDEEIEIDSRGEADKSLHEGQTRSSEKKGVGRFGPSLAAPNTLKLPLSFKTLIFALRS